jgi:monoamine oxidase
MSTVKRRRFVRTIVIGGAGALLPGPIRGRVYNEPPEPGATGLAPLPAPKWRRVVFEPAHALRDGHRFATPPPDERRDIVIVGGGAASLTAAYHLRDADFLVLEKEPHTGGNGHREEWNGIQYTTGTAYTGLPTTPLGRFFENDLGLKLLPIRSHDAYVIGERVVERLFPDGVDRLPFDESVRRDFRRLYDTVRSLAPALTPQVERGEGTLIEELDRMTLAAWLERERFTPEVRQFLALYCTPQVGGYPEDLSAGYACSVLGTYMGTYEENYTFPGGLGAANEVMRDRIERAGSGRIRTGAFVVRVAPAEEGRAVDVTWVGAAGEPRTVRCRVCIWGAPKYVARHVIEGMPEEQRQAVASLKYHNISVMNLCYRRSVFDRAYQAWIGGLPIVDLLPADWVLRHGKGDAARAQVLSCDWPVPIADRALLLDDAWVVARCQESARGLERPFPGSLDRLEEIRVYVRAHSWCVPSPGYITRLRSLVARPIGRVLMSRSDQIYFDTAYESGVEMAARAREILAGD